ncbi:MAG: HAMP domain-containing protein [Gammaproteobacteria bacterium]|nr:HAMP domain-containing protein [Gammaproteobacteria bacterium]
MIARPTSLLVRTNLTLAVSSLAIVAIAVVALQFFVVQPIAEQSADDQAALLVLTAQTWVELPPEARPYFELELAEQHDLYIGAEGAAQHPPARYDESPFLTQLEERLNVRLGQPVAITQGDDLLWATLPMGGYQLQVGFSGTRRDIQPLNVGLIIAGLGAGVVLITSAIIVLRVTRPLVQAAERAEAFRGGANFDPLPEKGPKELVVLARNLNTMAREISSLLSNRTTLLAGISHDLKTPLARMRLAVELLPESVDPVLVARLERNLESMDELITDALKFARGTHEPTKPTELQALVADLLQRQDPPIPFDCGKPAKTIVEVAPGALTRVLTNLINNAQQHGQNAQVRLRGRQVHVIDNGPGIPEAHREAVLQPFFRLDRSRSAATGGSGLGLAIAHQLCEAHGWSITISGHPSGGTDVCVSV